MAVFITIVILIGAVALLVRSERRATRKQRASISQKYAIEKIENGLYEIWYRPLDWGDENNLVSNVAPHEDAMKFVAAHQQRMRDY
jgi:hypothetical protein